MSDFTTRRADEASLPRADSPVQEFPRRDPRFRRPPAEADGENMVTQATSIVQRVAVSSIGEIEKLIGELGTVRDFLRQEGTRIQREIDGYARLSEEAIKSTRIISESVTQWKTTLTNIGTRRP